MCCRGDLPAPRAIATEFEHGGIRAGERSTNTGTLVVTPTPPLRQQTATCAAVRIRLGSLLNVCVLGVVSGYELQGEAATVNRLWRPRYLPQPVVRSRPMPIYEFRCTRCGR